MISNLLSYSGIVTKTRAMESHLLTISDYEKIANLTTVSDFVVFLKELPGYKLLFSNLDEHTLHRNQIENVLINALYLDYSKLFQFAGKHQRNALNFLFFRYEINIIKICFKQVFDSSSQFNLSVFESFFSRHSKLDLKRLSQAETIEEIVTELKNSDYNKLFGSLAKNDMLTLHDCELALDIHYYTQTWKMCRTILKGKERKVFQDTLGKQIDLLNLMWIYRSKKYFDADAINIYASLIPIHYKISKKQITDLIETNSWEEFTNLLYSLPYYVSFDKDNFSIETAYNQLLDKIYLDNKRRNQVSMSTLFNYLHRKEREIDHLTTALECIRYQLEPSLSLNYIIS